MTGKDNRNKNKGNSNKKSNVIYIDRNKKTGQISTKNTTKNIKNNKNTTKEKNNVEKNKPVKPKQNTSVKKSNANSSKKPKKIKKPKTSNNTPKKKGRKIKWERVAIAVLLVVALGFCGVKGVQMIKGKSSSANSATIENNSGSSSSANNENSAAGDSTDKKHPTKGQYDLDDEKKRQSKKYNIVVDAGHGGNDKGSIDSTETVYEKDIALQISKKVASRLGRESDVNVIMTRTEDKYVSLEERAEIAKRANADALVSIHLNAQKKFGDANGLETWYRSGATDGSKELANSVQQTTASYVEIMSRGILRNSFEILRETTMPAVLVECGFITNVSDMKKLNDPNFQDMLAEGIMQGTLTFLDEKNGKN